MRRVERRGRGGKLMGEFRRRAVCLVSLDKNHIGLGGTSGIHRAILMNCTAQAALNSASEAEFSLPIRCGFYLVSLRYTQQRMCLKSVNYWRLLVFLASKVNWSVIFFLLLLCLAFRSGLRIFVRRGLPLCWRILMPGVLAFFWTGKA